MILAFVSFFFLQNLVSSLGFLLSPLDAKTFEGPRGIRSFAFLCLVLAGAALWIWLIDWVFCVLLGLGFLRILLVFLNLAALGALGLIADLRMPRLLLGYSWVRYRILYLDLPLAGFALLALGREGGFGVYLVSLVGALAGSVCALFLFSLMIKRLELEWLPPSVRGKPLAFFAMSIISLIFLLAGFALYPILVVAQ